MRTKRNWWAILLVLAAPVWAADKLTGGNGTLYLGGRPNKIFIIDEATEKVTGEILCKTGTPVNLSLSQDHKRFYLMNIAFEDLEIVDIASRQVIDTFRLSEGNKKMRIFGYEADPLNRFIVLFVKTATKEADRFEIAPPALQVYDLKTHKVSRTIPWPKGEEREGVGMQFSPDGKLLYFFGDDILIYDTTDFKQVDKWELSRPIEDGFGRINFGALDDHNEEPGYFTGIFTVSDAVQNRRIMGIARVNLGQKSVEFYPLGPATGVSFTLAPGRKWGYGLHQEIGKYEFWSFDLANRRLGPRVEFPGRPRMSLKTSTNGKLLYIHGAGNTIDLYEASEFKYLRTISLDADMTTNLYVLPAK
ncbi:MAG: hypothetical protein LAP87_27870 [Acidobacteriia bacterium]|nr:hypothetical protein [Terriglobia bacterium]